jgi:TetR/AcrR family transcriptional regulator, transcriptional repressor for nem operon
MKCSNATRTKLLEAACDVIRAKGYASTTVDDVCAAAGVSKGGFFHHFASKEQLAIVAVAQFGAMAADLFGSAPYRTLADPLARLLGYVDFRSTMLRGDIAQFTCLMGTLTQEIYATHPDIRTACEHVLSAHVAELQQDIEAARQCYAPDAPWTAESLGNFMQAVLQGAFILVKAKQDTAVAIASLMHLRRYLETLFSHPAGSFRPSGNTTSMEMEETP